MDMLKTERARLAEELRADGFKPFEEWRPFWRYFATAQFIVGMAAAVKGAVSSGSPLGFVIGFLFVAPIAALIAGAMAWFDKVSPQPRPLWMSLGFPILLMIVFMALWVGLIALAL